MIAFLPKALSILYLAHFLHILFLLFSKSQTSSLESGALGIIDYTKVGGCHSPVFIYQQVPYFSDLWLI